MKIETIFKDPLLAVFVNEFVCEWPTMKVNIMKTFNWNLFPYMALFNTNENL